MSSDLKEFPPSDLKLERLRTEGVVPFSREVLHFAVILAAPVAIGAACAIADKILVDWARDMFSKSFSTKELVLRLGDGAEALFVLTAVAMGVVLLSALLIGAIQNRFLFSLSAISIQFSRLLSFSSLSFPQAISRFLASLTRLFIVIILIAIGFLSVRHFALVPDIDAQLLASSGDTKAAAKAALDSALARLLQVAGLIILISFFLGVVSRMLVVMSFRRRHRMTRAEVEAEYKETEGSPEFRSAQRNFLQ